MDDEREGNKRGDEEEVLSSQQPETEEHNQPEMMI